MKKLNKTQKRLVHIAEFIRAGRVLSIIAGRNGFSAHFNWRNSPYVDRNWASGKTMLGAIENAIKKCS
jgi:outer membrane biogenesis lipoprotein LolB